MLIDSHINIHGEAYDEDREIVFQRARDVGVSPFIAICCRLNEYDAVRSVAETHDDVFFTVGAHPHHAKDHPDITVEELVKLASHPKIIAIGETGLDFYYGHSSAEDQQKSLRTHFQVARELELPVILHSRDADDAMSAVLDEEMAKGPVKALLHCYTGGEGLARKGVVHGAWFSASGIITFKKAQDVRDIFEKIVPDDRVIVETDCPYLAPVPMRGQRNEPSYLPHVAEKLGELKSWNADEAARRTTENCLALFDRLPR